MINNFNSKVVTPNFKNVIDKMGINEIMQGKINYII